MSFVSMEGRIAVHKNSAVELHKICRELLQNNKELNQECKNLSDVVIAGAITNRRATRTNKI